MSEVESVSLPDDRTYYVMPPQGQTVQLHVTADLAAYYLKCAESAMAPDDLNEMAAAAVTQAVDADGPQLLDVVVLEVHAGLHITLLDDTTVSVIDSTETLVNVSCSLFDDPSTGLLAPSYLSGLTVWEPETYQVQSYQYDNRF